MTGFIDTHAHLDGEEFAQDRDQVVERARQAGVSHVLLPAIDLKSAHGVMATCECYPGYCHPMIGLHPEEVSDDWRQQLQQLRPLLGGGSAPSSGGSRVVAIGEVGLDYYWSRAYEHEQLEALEEQVEWSVATGLPLMIHCRKAQNELVTLLRHYERELPGGVFHCFTGNVTEASQLLQFERFVLGVGGVLTFKKSKLPQTLAEAVPLSRIVLETDAPYMAPVPCRGQRNEPALVAHVLQRLAETYGVEPDEVAATTTATVARIFPLLGLGAET